MTEEQLERQFPAIPWREPVKVSVIGNPTAKICCRFCIAIKGLKADEVHLVGFDNESGFRRHIVENHPWKCGDEPFRL